MNVADYLVLGRIRARQIRHRSITLPRVALKRCSTLVGKEIRMQRGILDVLAPGHNVDIARRRGKDRCLRSFRLEEGKRILEHLGRSELDIFCAHQASSTIRSSAQLDALAELSSV